MSTAQFSSNKSALLWALPSCAPYCTLDASGIEDISLDPPLGIEDRPRRGQIGSR
jgi:hypothetical protein